MSLFKPSGSSLYYYKFMYKGQTFYGPTGEADKRKAQKVEEEAKGKAKRDHLLRTPTAVASAGVVPTWEECVDKYLKRREEEGGIVNQVEDETLFDRLTDWIGANTLITSVTEETVRMCVRKRAAMPKLNPITKEPKFKLNEKGEMVPDLVSVATVNRQTWQLIRRVHEFAGKKLKVKNLEVIDWGDIARGRPEPVRTREITLAEEERIMALSGDTGYGAAYRFGVLSGLRWQALCNLKWGQVNFETMEITVINKRSARLKTERRYSIPIDSEMVKVLMAQKGKHPVMVFTFIHGDANWINPKNGVLYETGKTYPITAWGFRSWFDRTKVKAGLPDVRIHDIRRTAGGRVNRASGLVAASKLLGHSSVAPTAKHYAHHTTDEQREAQERAHVATKQRRERMRAVMDPKSDPHDCQGFVKVLGRS